MLEAESAALKLLASREHSRLELARKLAVRGFAEEAVETALDRLIQGGAIDESRLAEHYVHERMGKGFGPVRIRGELRRKGLAEAVVDRHLGRVSDDFANAMVRVYDRRFGDEPPQTPAEFAKRARFLEQRGFTTDSIRRFLRWND